jgi:NAD dependent epimerase/dehydratase
MSDIFKGAQTYVTGADGFIGSHLVEALVRRGAKVRALVYYNSWNNIGWLADVKPEIRKEMEIVFGDVRDTEHVASSVRGSRYVFHLASLIGIPYSYEAARSYVDTNISGALNVLEACRKADTVERLIHTSTSEVYGSAQTVPISESHPLVGQSPYSATKIGADKLAESYHLSFGVPVVIARPFNTYGPRQTARAVIPTTASQLLSGVNRLKLGALSPTRDFNYATDTVGGFLALAGCAGAEGQVINIGSGEEFSIEAMAKLLMEITGREVPIDCDEVRIRPAGSEVNRLLADNTKITQMTGWTPRVPFRRGLEETVQWIGRNMHLFDTQRYAV